MSTESAEQQTPSKKRQRKATQEIQSSKTSISADSKAVKKRKPKKRDSKAWLRRQWGKMVKRRDRWTCKECGARPGARYVQAHHILPVETHPELMFKLDNGITLCLHCHAAKHPKTAHLILRRLTKMAPKKKGTKKASSGKAGAQMPMKGKGGC